jgi:hypothetical protein
LEELIATCEAEQRGERITGGQERDDKDRQHGLAEPELWFFCVEARQEEVAARVLASLLEVQQEGTTHPPKIIHDAASAIRRQYHGVDSRFS